MIIINISFNQIVTLNFEWDRGNGHELLDVLMSSFNYL
jgi:hypothetical protein